MLLAFTLFGCAPSYPKAEFKESIIKLCKDEYNIDVKVETVGKTIAIYLPLSNLIDFTFAITKEASEKIGNVILSVSRVALSTDAKYDFYCIIAHDVRIPDIQIVIIKSIDDVKRFFLGDISRNEYTKRMLIDIRMTPQAQKEKSIREVLDKMVVDKKAQEQFLSEFFRNEPAGLNEIGYWNGKFYIKDVTLPEFLADQVASRIRIAFKEDKKLAESFLVKSSKGSYSSQPPRSIFRFEIFATATKVVVGTKGESNIDDILEESLKVASAVIHGYRFKDYEYIDIINQANGGFMRVSQADAEKFYSKKIKFSELKKKVY